MAPEPYRGPVSLATSKYASPVRKANFGAYPTATPTASPSAKIATPTSTIATKEQIAASAVPANTSTTDMAASYNPDAQLAMAQNGTLKAEVDKHTVRFSKALSSAVVNTRHLLQLMRESIKKDSPCAATDLQTVDHLWIELEQLFNAAQEANSALPVFMDKQKDNMSLYHNSVMNETIRETQDELNLQHKKVNIQHSLILEHQQAFQDYKAETDTKLNGIEALQDRVSRLTLDKGLLRTELDKFTQDLQEARNLNESNLRATKNLRGEIETLQDSKKQLENDNGNLRATIDQLQETFKADQQKATDDHDKDLRQANEALTKTTQEKDALMGRVNTLRKDKEEAEIVKKAYTKLQANYKYQGAEHAMVFSQSKDQAQKIVALTAELEQAHRETADLKSQMGQLDELKGVNASLSTSNADLEAQIEQLKEKLSGSGEQKTRTKVDLNALSEKVKKLEKENDELEKENDELEMENNELFAKSAEHKKVAGVVAALRDENAKLKITIKDLHKSSGGGVVASAAADQGIVKDLEDRLRAADEGKAKMEAALQEWIELAKRSYNEYKEMLPQYKAAESLRDECARKDLEISDLKQKLHGTKGPVNATVATSGVDSPAYWKAKYEAVLAAGKY